MCCKVPQGPLSVKCTYIDVGYYSFGLVVPRSRYMMNELQVVDNMRKYRPVGKRLPQLCNSGTLLIINCHVCI